MPYCCIKQCGSKKGKNHPFLSLHRFPEDEELRRKWKEVIGEENITNVKSLFICSLHFCESSFIKTTNVARLHYNAVPSLSLPDADSENPLTSNGLMMEPEAGFRHSPIPTARDNLKLQISRGSPTLASVCRVCLSTDSKLYDMKQYNLVEPYEMITGINVTGETYPHKLCVECAQRLLNCIRFRGKCVRGHIVLTEIWDTYGGLTAQSVKSVDRHQNGLVSQLQVKHIEADHYDLYCKHADHTDTHRDEMEIYIDELKNYEASTIKIEREYADVLKTKTEVLEDSYQSGFVELTDQAVNSVDRKLQVKHVKADHCDLYSEHTDHTDTQYEMAIEDTVEIDTVTLSDSDETAMEDSEEEENKETDSDNVEYDDITEIDSDDVDNDMAMDDVVIKSITVLRKAEIALKKKKKSENVNSWGKDFEEMFTVTEVDVEEQKQLQKKKMTNIYRVQFTCNVCNKQFTDDVAYKNHIVRHTTKFGTYQCDICKLYYRNKTKLKDHLDSHRRKFQCKKCTFVASYRTAATNHILFHKGVKFKCDICDMQFENRSTYYSHKRLKHPTDNVCEYCGYTFLSQQGLCYHKFRQHRLEMDTTQITSDSPLCETCDIRFYSEDALKVHMAVSDKHKTNDGERRVHNAPKRRKNVRPGHTRLRYGGGTNQAQAEAPMPCEQCGEVLDSRRAYYYHFRRVHRGMTRTVYSTKSETMCEECGKMFRCAALLREHKNVHTGERRYMCDKCEKTFITKNTLQIHMKIHSVNRPLYDCPICGNKFTEKGNRDRHMILHTGKRAFKCEVCSKTFATDYERYTHNKYVHLKVPWPKRKPRRRRVTQPTED